ncbi:MAG TPA: GtrA family protein, partial [Steroidobacteraceae bacterium]|nr:GtrA family protein [Steroidobacteraceae bacterium]
MMPEHSVPLTAWPETAAGRSAPINSGGHAWQGETTLSDLLLDYARQHAAQLARFLLIGATLAVLNLWLLHLLRTSLSISDSVAVAIMYACGALPHFIAHRWITYGVQDQPVRPQGARYLVMLVCNFLLMQLLVALAARLSLSPYIAVMTSTACTMTFNFLAMTHVVFRSVRHSVTAGLDGASGVEVPREIVTILQQRGVTAGSVLVLANSSPGSRTRHAPHFHVTCGPVAEASALLRERRFAAVVARLEDLTRTDAESVLAAMAPQLTPATLLVASLPDSSRDSSGRPGSGQPDPAWDSIHLALLRSGYERAWPHRTSRLWVSARSSCARARRTCSIIVPVYNEKETFPQLMLNLLSKRLDHLGLEREIILVESNSTDGTRELVAGFA